MAHFTQNNNYLLLYINYKHIIAITVIPHYSTKLNKTKKVNSYPVITQLLLQVRKLKRISQQDEPRQNLTGPQACPISLTGAKPVACCKQWQQHNTEAGRDSVTTL